MPTTNWSYLSPDEARYLKLALEMLLESNIADATFKPGLPMFIVGVMIAVGKTEIAGYVIAQTLGTLLVPTSYLIGKELRGKRSGLLAAFLFAISGPFIHHSSRVLTDLPSLFFSLISILCIIRGFNNIHQRESIAYSITSGFFLLLAVLIRPSVVALLGGYFLIAIYYRITRGQFGKTLQLMLGGLLSLTVPFVSILVISPPLGMGFANAIMEALGHFLSGLSPFQVGWNFGVLAARGGLVLGLVITPYSGESLFYFSALILSIIALRDAYARRGKSDALLVSWILVYGLLYLLASDIVAWEDWRYMLPIFAPLLFLISFSIDQRLDGFVNNCALMKEKFLSLSNRLSHLFHRNLYLSTIFVIMLGLLTLLPIPLLFLLPLFLCLVWLSGLANHYKVSRWSVIVVFLIALLSASNYSILTASNISAQENSIENWEVYAPPSASTFEPYTTEGIKTWVTQFELPYIQKPSMLNMTEGGIFLWSDTISNRDSFTMAWNNTAIEINGEIRVRGFAFLGYSGNGSIDSIIEVSSTGYYTYLRFNLKPTESLLYWNISLEPIREANDFRIEVDVYDEMISSICIGQKNELLPYTVDISWLSLHVSWEGSTQQDLDFRVESLDLELNNMIILDGIIPVQISSESGSSKNLQIFANSSAGHFVIFYDNVLGNAPQISITATSMDIPLPIHAENSEFSNGLYSIVLQPIHTLFPDTSSGVVSTNPLLVLIVLSVILCSFFGTRKYALTKPFEILILSTFITYVLYFLTLSFSNQLSLGFSQLGPGIVYYQSALAIRTSLLVGGLFTFILLLGNLFYKDKDSTLQSTVSKSLHAFPPLGKEDVRSLLVISLIGLLFVSGPISGFEYAMESREVFDSIQKCGKFLHNTYADGTTVLTNENGPWYVEWFGELHLDVSSISYNEIQGSTNISQLILDTIDSKNIQIIVVFERLSFSFTETYSLLYELGYLKLIRSYDEVGGWKSIVYETVESIR